VNILDQKLKQWITKDLVAPIIKGDSSRVVAQTPVIIDALIANIPPNRRSSYGRVYAVKVLSRHLYSELSTRSLPLFDMASTFFQQNTEARSKGVWLGVLSYLGLGEFESVVSAFEAAAAAKNWEIREFAQMFFRKLIKQHPDASHAVLLRLVKSEDPNIRRFVAETLRPVRENQSFYENPNYPLSILRHLFTEEASYPRTAVGNNLSDLARRLPELVYSLVEELVESDDKNSYWIAYRACRNLVKKDPVKVMRLLRVKEYHYKSRIHRLSDFA
jgi:3-methyladenine DNA glycosylase AlkC